MNTSSLYGPCLYWLFCQRWLTGNCDQMTKNTRSSRESRRGAQLCCYHCLMIWFDANNLATSGVTLPIHRSKFLKLSRETVQSGLYIRNRCAPKSPKETLKQSMASTSVCFAVHITTLLLLNILFWALLFSVSSLFTLWGWKLSFITALSRSQVRYAKENLRLFSILGILRITSQIS